MNMVKKIIWGLGLFIVIAVLAALYNFLISGQPDENLRKLLIGNNVFKVEIADTPSKQAHGLSGRYRLARDRGMLFVFKRLEKRGFWMARMKFPLDIVWISNGKIIGVSENLPPVGALSGAPVYYSPEPVDWVLEINAGLTNSFGIKIGDRAVLE